MADKVFLITGASSGIGAATARAASRRGFRVVLAARRRQKLDQLAEELGGSERALAVQCDVTQWNEQQEMIGCTLDRFGQIDVILANAGIYRSGGGFVEGNPDHWKEMILTNVYGAGLTLRAGLVALKRTKGHILLLGSAAGRRPIAGSMYGATKWAVTAMGQNLREELRGTGIRVTLVEPGVTNTELFSQARPNAMEVEDVANAILFAVEQHPRVDMHEILMYPTPEQES
ncbi:MAG: SDR family oxidoreductase [Acidiferrobacterales bacterium]|nr:SDR family oxidoreductase [Acidiferrobacterales bacterium]